MSKTIWSNEDGSWRLHFPGERARAAVEEFVAQVQEQCVGDHPDLRRMCDWAYGLGISEVAYLQTTRSTIWPALRLIPQGHRRALATVNHDATNPHTFLRVWGSVAEAVAPDARATLERKLGRLGQGMETRSPTETQLRAVSAAFREAAQRHRLAPKITQRITAVDLVKGRIRIPGEAKSLLPSDRRTIDVRLLGRRYSVGWDPRLGPDRPRSGVLRVGRDALAGLAADTVLRISRNAHGVVQLERQQ